MSDLLTNDKPKDEPRAAEREDASASSRAMPADVLALSRIERILNDVDEDARVRIVSWIALKYRAR